MDLTVKLSTRIPIELRRRVRQHCLDNDLTIEQWLASLIEQALTGDKVERLPNRAGVEITLNGHRHEISYQVLLAHEVKPQRLSLQQLLAMYPGMTPAEAHQAAEQDGWALYTDKGGCWRKTTDPGPEAA